MTPNCTVAFQRQSLFRLESMNTAPKITATLVLVPMFRNFKPLKDWR